MPYFYYAFGLNIESEIECPLLIAGDGSAPDLVIRLGPVPHELRQAQVQESFYQINARHCLLNIDKVARYLVTDGSEIIVEPHPAAAEKDVRLFLLGSAMGALLHQRGVWPLHGSAVAGRRGAVLFVGATGSGKSSLAGAFHQRGFQTGVGPDEKDGVGLFNAGNGGIEEIAGAFGCIELRAVRPAIPVR